MTIMANMKYGSPFIKKTRKEDSDEGVYTAFKRKRV